MGSINKYKSEFAINFAKIMEKNLELWKRIQNLMRRDLFSLKTLGWYAFIVLVCFLPGKNEREYHVEVHAVIAAIALVFAIFAKIHITNKAYQNAIKKTLFPSLLGVFGDIKYFCPSRVNKVTSWANNIIGNIFDDSSSRVIRTELQEIHKQLYLSNNLNEMKDKKTISTHEIENTGLIPKNKITEREDDDCFWGIYKDVNFTMNEANMGYITYDKHHNEYFHSVFKGLVLEFTMNKKISCPIIIRTKTLTSGIGTFKDYERVNLESVKFAKKYDVWAKGSEGQVEARYFLTSLMLDRFMNIQTSFRIKNMSCSIMDNKLIILLKTNNDLFEMNHLFSKIDDIKQYHHLFDEMISILSFIEVLNLSSKTGL